LKSSRVLTFFFAFSFALAALALTTPARAQVFGQYTDASTLPVNGRLFGGYLHSSEHIAGLLAQLRLSFYPGFDFGFQGGVARRTFEGSGDRSILRLGTDLKAAVRKQSDSYPVSIAAGAGIGVETGDDFHTLLFVPNVVVSHAFFSGDSTGTGSGGISPYVGIGLSFTSFDIGTEHDGEFAVPIRAGADMRFNSQLGLVLEMQLYLGGNLNNHFGLGGGVNLPF
jgi:hypothetical protein